MTTTTIASTDVVVSVEPLFSEPEQIALAGFLAGYSGLTRDAYALDLPMFTAWCQRHGLHRFQARRANIEGLGRDMETRGRARATIARRLCTSAGLDRYAVEEELLEHSSAVHARRPRLDYESRAIGLDRNEVGSVLVTAGLGAPNEHALISLLAINGLRISEAPSARQEIRSVVMQDDLTRKHCRRTTSSSSNVRPRVATDSRGSVTHCVRVTAGPARSWPTPPPARQSLRPARRPLPRGPATTTRCPSARVKHAPRRAACAPEWRPRRWARSIPTASGGPQAP